MNIYLVVCFSLGDLLGDLLAGLMQGNTGCLLEFLSSAVLISEEEELSSFCIFSISFAKVTFLSCFEGDGAREIRDVSLTSSLSSPLDRRSG